MLVNTILLTIYLHLLLGYWDKIEKWGSGVIFLHHFF